VISTKHQTTMNAVKPFLPMQKVLRYQTSTVYHCFSTIQDRILS